MSEHPTRLEVVIEYDADHVQHVMFDARRGYLEDEQAREELDNLESGEWTAYGVTVARVCDCCDSLVEPYVTALWGCVVETTNQDGRYAPSELARIEDDYLRELAVELLEEAASIADARADA